MSTPFLQSSTLAGQYFDFIKEKDTIIRFKTEI